MKIMSVMPAATASSTAYWMSGLSTTGSISLGEALVAGRNRVPIPATGKTAFVTFCISLCTEQLEELGLVQDRHPQLARLVELGAGFIARDDVIRLFGNRAAHLAPEGLDPVLRLV